jgi:hypothetical protein
MADLSGRPSGSAPCPRGFRRSLVDPSPPVAVGPDVCTERRGGVSSADELSNRDRRTPRAPIPQRGFGQLRGRSTGPNRGRELPCSRSVPNSCGPRAPAKGDPMEAGPPLGQEPATTADGQK